VELWVDDARVLVDFTEEVLAIDKVERPPPEGLKGKPKPLELRARALGDYANDVVLVEVGCIAETLPNAIARPRASYDEIHLRKVEDLAVVQIDGELEREKVPERWVAAEDLEDLLQ
jgi:hypothetical protein